MSPELTRFVISYSYDEAALIAALEMSQNLSYGAKRPLAYDPT